MSNGFLKDFMEMRKALVPANHPGRSGVVDPLPKNPSDKGKKKKQQPSFTQQTEGEVTMAKIIEDKPPKNDVIRYLQHLANELTTKKMA